MTVSAVMIIVAKPGLARARAGCRALHGNVEYAVLVGGRRGGSLLSGCGVKQGCPLSPHAA